MSTTLEITTDQLTQAHEQIEEFRREIDVVDAKMVANIAKRLSLVRKIGEIKRNANLSVHDPARESSQFAHYVHLAKLNHVSPEQVVIPFMAIIHLSRQAQNGTKVIDNSPIVPKLCLLHGWRTCGIEVPESAIRVCPTCHTPLF